MSAISSTFQQSRPETSEPRIGPNAVLQSWRALDELEDATTAARVRARAGLAETLPDGMIPEAWFLRVIDALRGELDADRAERVLRRAGMYTAVYVANRRIPATVRTILGVLPARVAIPILFTAFRKHAWTFAGAGRFSAEGDYPGTLVLDGAPTCRERRRGDRMSGAYYEAAFEGLLRIASANVHVREVACQAAGAPRCRFQVTLHAPAGEVSCASS